MDWNICNNIDGKTSIPVAFAPDDNFALMTLISMVSIAKNTNRNIDFLILYSKLSEKSFEILKFVTTYSHCKVTFVEIDADIFKEFQNASWVTIQAWFRVLIPDILKNASKAIYLDCDTMAHGDIAELYDIDVNDTLIGAVREVWNVKAWCDRLKLKSNYIFNSGMMLINCDKWRSVNLFEKLKDCALNNPTIKYGDEDCLNFVIDEDKKGLSTKFNYIETWWFNYFHEYTGDEALDYEQSKRNPVIIHFTGVKPFHPKSRHSFRNEWWQIAKETPYYTMLLEKYRTDCENYVDELGRNYTKLDNLLKRAKELDQSFDNIEKKLNNINSKLN